MLKRALKLSHHHHTGKILAHHHTSYAPLLILLGIVGMILGAYTAYAQSPGPEAGSIGLTGVVEGDPPDIAATINEPSDNDRFATSPITVSGTCPPGTLVEVYKNDIFAGSTVCSSEGLYSFDIDLLFGQNTLTARVYDALGQPGPDSNAVVIFYDALPPQSSPINSLDFGSAQLLLNTDSVFRGAFPNEEVGVPVSILGGTPPFAVNVQWGDANNDVISRNDNLNFTAAHAYTRAGTYQVSLQGSDAEGRVAFLTVAAIVNGQPGSAAGSAATDAQSTLGTILALWPFYVSTVAIVVSFWLGEMREKRVMKKQGIIYNT